MTEEQFINEVLKIDVGIIALCNLLDGVDKGFISNTSFKEFFAWWRMAASCCIQGPTSREPIVHSLIDITMSPEEWDRWGSASYPGISSFGKKPDFRALNRRSARITTETPLATTTDGFLDFLATEDTKKMMMKRADLDTTPEGSKVSSKYRKKRKTIYKNCLKTGSQLGKPGGVLWYTKAEIMHKYINKRDADSVRDFLGLIHIRDNVNLFTIEFNKESPSLDSRPTTLDAGGSTRFKQVADGIKSKARSAWGYTADLNSFKGKKRIIDGAPERVCTPISCDIVNNVKVYSLGRTKLERGVSSGVDDHSIFAKRLQSSRTLKNLKRDTIKLLSMH